MDLIGMGLEQYWSWVEMGLGGDQDFIRTDWDRRRAGCKLSWDGTRMRLDHHWDKTGIDLWKNQMELRGYLKE